MPAVAEMRVISALIRRAMNEIARVPAAAIPGVLAPTIIIAGLASVFSKAAELPGYEAPNFLSYIIAVGFLQGAGFTGAATGVNLARDIEQGWFDRLLLAPVPRLVILAGIVGSAALRALLPASFLLLVGEIFGAAWPGFAEILVMVPIVCGYAAIAACWGAIIALRFKTQQAAPLMQIGMFAATLLTTAYAPFVLLTPWLEEIARLNPVTYILEGVRQGFVGDVTWATTWPAFVALFGLLAIFGGLALRSMRRTGLS
ncbi:MAG: ABC transporter permease [Solirubrobacterales bacterium]|nr:ABC transporter permease [Solirubrobacterales bacterium]